MIRINKPSRIPSNKEKLDLATYALKGALDLNATAEELEYLLRRVERAKAWVESEGPGVRRVHRVWSVEDSYH